MSSSSWVLQKVLKMQASVIYRDVTGRRISRRYSIPKIMKELQCNEADISGPGEYVEEPLQEMENT